MRDNLIISKTSKGNSYLNNQQLNRISLLHPILADMIINEDNSSSDDSCAPNSYYRKKLQYWKKHGLLEKYVENPTLLYINANDIYREMANTAQIVFEVTDSCNLKCKYCSFGELYSDYDARLEKKMDINKAKKLIDYLVPLWLDENNRSFNQRVNIGFYGGEPLMNVPFIKEIISYIESIDAPNRQFSYSMTTNGVFLGKHMDYLVEKSFNLLISLDGDAENSVYRIDKNDKTVFHIVEKNVDRLREKYPEYFDEHVNFNSVLHDKNSVEGIAQFFENKYSKTPSISEISNDGVSSHEMENFEKMLNYFNDSIQKSSDPDVLREKLFMETSDYRGLTNFLHHYAGFSFNNYNELFFSQNNSCLEFVPTGTCIPFSRKIFLSVNGKLLPCERISHNYSMGYISDNYEVIVNLEQVTERYNRFLDKVMQQCKSCYFDRICYDCIFRMNYQEMSTETAICQSYMDKKYFSRYTASLITLLENHPVRYKEIMTNIYIK